VLVLAGLAVGLREPAPSLDDANLFVTRPESVVGFELVAQRFPDLAGQPLTVLVRPAQRSAVLATVAATPGVRRAVPGRVGASWAEITATPLDPPGSPGERDTILLLRDRVHAIGGADARVGGRSAQLLDESVATDRDRRRVMPLILGVVLVILMLLLRAVVAPVLLVGTVVLSFAAAMGASLLVFTHGFGFPGIGPTIPLFGFLFLVALGVDYNIFLMSRAREEARRVGTADGTTNALASTGGVITSAGLVLAATFAVLAMLPLVFMVELGFLVAFGVLLDTFVVRSVLVPALAFGVGRRIWWPGRPDGPSRATASSRPAAPLPPGPVDAAPTCPPVDPGPGRHRDDAGWLDPVACDALSRSLSAIGMQAGVARHLLDTVAPGHSAAVCTLRGRLREIAETCRLGIAELQAQPDAPGTAADGSSAAGPGLDRLGALVEWVRSTGTAVRVSVTGQPRRLPGRLDVVAYRLAGEALVTLAGQPGRTVLLYVEYRPTNLRLAVGDEAAGEQALRLDVVLPCTEAAAAPGADATVRRPH